MSRPPLVTPRNHRESLNIEESSQPSGEREVSLLDNSGATGTGTCTVTDEQSVPCDFIPLMLDWVRPNNSYNYTANGGDCFLLPVFRNENSEKVVLLDSGCPSALQHILTALGLPVHRDSNLTGTPHRNLVGAIITHKDDAHTGGFTAMLAFAIHERLGAASPTFVLDIVKSLVWKDMDQSTLESSCSRALKTLEFFVYTTASQVDSRTNDHLIDLFDFYQRRLYGDGTFTVLRRASDRLVFETVLKSSYARIMIAKPKAEVSELPQNDPPRSPPD